MNARALNLGIAMSVVLLGIAGGLYVLAGSGAERDYRSAITVTRQLQQLSSEWSVELARVKSDPLADFDSLAAFIPRMARLKESLRITAQGLPALPDRVAGDINAYLSTIEAKEERIERFKTGYAVVRNSARYLPLAAANVIRQAQDADDEALVRRVTALAQDTNLYLANPTETARTRLAEELRRLLETSVSRPPALANGLVNLIAHAEVLLDKQAPTEELFQRAISGDISDRSELLAGSLEFELGKKELLAVWYERGVLALIAVLALFWVGLALQQRARGGAAAAPDTAPAPVPAPAQADDPDEALSTLASAPLRQDAEALAAAELAVPAEDAPAKAPGARPAPTLSRELSAAAPAPIAQPEIGAEAALTHGFLARCVADNLAASANRIATRMDYLRQTQSRIQQVLQANDALLPALADGTDLDEEIEAAGAITIGVRREMNALTDLARRLASSAMPNGTIDRDMIDLNACVEDALDATGAEEAVTVAKRLGNVPEIFASRAEIFLLLTQIIENAVLAVQGLEERHGTIKVDTARRGDDILITVIDNGAGITAERRARIFKPFYTTRDGAMGLGLTLASHLASKYEGDIKVNSLPEQGTVARITLPVDVLAP